MSLTKADPCQGSSLTDMSLFLAGVIEQVSPGSSGLEYRADLRIHWNRRGTMELGEGPYRATIDQGISPAPEGSCRPPLLGLRALVRSGLVMKLRGKRRVASPAPRRRDRGTRGVPASALA